MVIRIVRKRPRPGGDESPTHTGRGYELADPHLGPGYHKVENAKFVQSLEEAADLIEDHGFAIRMNRPGKRPSLVSRKSLHIIRD